MGILKLECLNVIVNNQKIKSFNETLLESYWSCLTFEPFDFEESNTLKGILKKLNEINQRWLLGKLVGFLKKGDFSIIKYSTEIKLKVK
jgi:hypothetical protein